jgi:hypothetical protein
MKSRVKKSADRLSRAQGARAGRIKMHNLHLTFSLRLQVLFSQICEHPPDALESWNGSNN